MGVPTKFRTPICPGANPTGTSGTLSGRVPSKTSPSGRVLVKCRSRVSPSVTGAICYRIGLSGRCFNTPGVWRVFGILREGLQCYHGGGGGFVPPCLWERYRGLTGHARSQVDGHALLRKLCTRDQYRQERYRPLGIGRRIYAGP